MKYLMAKGKILMIPCLLVALMPIGAFSQSGTDSSGGVRDSYVISPLDYLRVALSVADDVQFATELRVTQSGTITVPHLGTVEVAGLSVDAARQLLYEPYNRDYYVDPHIDITILEYAQRSVTVVGKVNRQGVIPFPSEKGLTLMEAIAAAGGWSNDRLANKDKVTITRTSKSGEKSVITIDARELTGNDYPLQDGDLINVPERIF
jgi:polysaccharide export outer membrane protein